MPQMAKRVYDLVFASLGLVILLPLLAVLAVLVKVADGGPIFFGQSRVGRGGTPFRIWKFRTMVPDAEKRGLSITAGGDSRITRVGRMLRTFKLDELPQLWNVLRGEMSLVGPRPEVPRYVALYTAEQRRVLDLRPGITDLASIEFRHEEELLATATDKEKFYVECCLPRKIDLNLCYAASAGLWSDTVIIIRTLVPPLDNALRKRGSRHQ